MSTEARTVRRPPPVDVWRQAGGTPPPELDGWWETTESGRAALATASQVSSSLRADLMGSPDLSVHVCREGVNRALTRFHASLRREAPNGKCHFLIADGTGTGKGFQVMLVAAMSAEMSGQPALVVTRPDLVPGLLRDARHLGLPLQPGRVEVLGYDHLEEKLHQAGRSGRRYSLLALDEAQDVVSAASLRQSVDAAPTQNILYLSATPFVTRQGAVYFLSRLSGQSETSLSEELGSNLAATISGIERRNRELFNQGALVRREFPFWGEQRGAQIYEATPHLQRAEWQLQQTYLQHFRQVKTDREIQTTQENFDREIRALSDENLIEPACREIEKQVRAGRKVIFYGTDLSIPALSPTGAETSRRYEGLLTGLQARLAARGLPAARLSEGSVGQSSEAQVLQNSLEANRFIDFPVLNVDGNPVLNGAGEKVVRSECHVVLLPPSQSAGWSQFCQRYPSGRPVVVVSTLPERADDLQQQEGRVSRITSCAPAEAKILAQRTMADRERAAKVHHGNAYLQAAGSLWYGPMKNCWKISTKNQLGIEFGPGPSHSLRPPSPKRSRLSDLATVALLRKAASAAPARRAGRLLFNQNSNTSHCQHGPRHHQRARPLPVQDHPDQNHDQGGQSHDR